MSVGRHLLDEYARESGLASRTAALQAAVRQLRRRDLEQDYAAAFEEWDASGDRDLWEGTAGDSWGDAPR